ncbi:hypothetical protein [Citrobacter freundii]|nr:hypothetical protein [Citrobacter freundii]
MRDWVALSILCDEALSVEPYLALLSLLRPLLSASERDIPPFNTNTST